MLGSLLIKMNVYIALYRRDSVLRDWPILEVIGVTAVTATVSYLVRPILCLQLRFHNLYSFPKIVFSRWVPTTSMHRSGPDDLPVYKHLNWLRTFSKSAIPPRAITMDFASKLFDAFSS